MRGRKGPFVLAGDIGGTKTNMGLFEKGVRRPRLIVLKTYASEEAAGLNDIIEDFIENHPARITGACFGIPGPVVKGRAKTTNLPWIVSEDRIGKRFGWRKVRVINDLAATAYGVPLLGSKELYPLSRVRIKKEKTLALVAPGTGLGVALIIHRFGRYFPVASEGGHADFGPNTSEEADLWAYLFDRFGHVSAERLLSGSGLVNIYSWLRDSGRYKEPVRLSRKFEKADPAKTISEVALGQGQPLCVKALDMFISIFGAFAGNLALTGMALGGVYLGGGISPGILPRLKEGGFMKAFADKGRFRDLLEKIAVRVVLNEETALLGAAHCAFEHAEGE